MSEKHTPERWTLKHISGSNFAVQEFDIRGTFDGSEHVYPIFNKDTSAIDGATVFMSPENAHRIVLCVNALAGVPTKALEEGAVRGLRMAAEEARACLAKYRDPTQTDLLLHQMLVPFKDMP